jgi:hypothetical protein
VIALLALLAASAEPDYSDYRQVVAGQVQQFRNVHQVQQQCESLLLQYTEISVRNRKYLERTAWDLPGGWVDPTSIDNSRRQFMKIALLLRDDIDRAQRSPRPRVAECTVAYKRAVDSNYQLLRSLLYNGR